MGSSAVSKTIYRRMSVRRVDEGGWAVSQPASSEWRLTDRTLHGALVDSEGQAYVNNPDRVLE